MTMPLHETPSLRYWRETPSVRYLRQVSAALALLDKPAPSLADTNFWRAAGLSPTEAAATLAISDATMLRRRLRLREPEEEDWSDPNAEHSTLNCQQQGITR
jgi:hypothetical protein